MRNSWPLVRLGEVLRVAIDGVPVDPSASYPIAGVYSFGRGLLSRAPLLGSETTYKVLHRLHADDFVLSQLKGWEGALAKIPRSFDGWFLSPQFPTFRAITDQLDISYLDWYCKQSKVWETLRNAARGMGARRDSVSPNRFLALEVPLPSLPEQRRVVARIEALAAKIHEARTLQAQSQNLRHSLLTSACHTITSKYKDYMSVLSEGIVSARNGISRRPSGIEVGPIVLRLADLSNGVVDLSNPRRGDLTVDEIEQYRLEVGDLLFIRVNGSREIVGRCILFYGNREPICFNDHIIRVRVDKRLLDPQYVAKMAVSPLGRDYMESVAITTAGQNTINHEMLKNLPLPILSLEQQGEIVAGLDALEAQVDALKKIQAEAAAELDALLPSILDRAFTGNL